MGAGSRVDAGESKASSHLGWVTRCTAQSARTGCNRLEPLQTILTTYEAAEAPQNAFVRVLKVILRR